MFPQSFEENPKITIVKKECDRHYTDQYGLPKRFEKEYNREVIVLQMMVFGNDEFIVEYVFVDELESK